MKLKWAQKEFSVGRYVYIVDDADDPSAQGRICYVWTFTPRAKEFVAWLCQRPERVADVQARLSPGKEVRAQAIRALMG